MNRKIIGVTVGTTMNPEKILAELRKTIDDNTVAIEKLTRRVALLESGIISSSAILGSAKLGTMTLGRGA